MYTGSVHDARQSADIILNYGGQSHTAMCSALTYQV